MASSGESEFRSMSPSDDVFFKGRLVPVEQNGGSISDEDAFLKPQTAVSRLKSATRFRVFMLRLRKPKATAAEPNATASPKQSGFLFKFKVEEVPIVSLFSRDGSGRSQSGGTFSSPEDAGVAPSSTTEENNSSVSLNSMEVVQKYLGKIKPLYVRVSKKYVEKLRFSGQLVTGGLPVAVPSVGDEKGEAELIAAEKAGKTGEKMQKLAMPASLRVVYELLGKLKSSSSATVAAVSPPQKRDDSLIQQQDGIQSAIAHCKKSFAADSKESKSSLP
ncbi:hypothetical protein HPP92_019559 [Vanilla planifolia]|uniref:Membrane-associated kinase regulator 2 n=1 Tax=Vanilla planifolia TaxID=51239 RepID=A0A835Q330_VANPL|nr:hypothetical protein HPP92_019991 [Vanilla planifolia]KAG0465395.1 hypothetical protein HPP92_019559 [Vanilla planifolia]